MRQHNRSKHRLPLTLLASCRCCWQQNQSLSLSPVLLSQGMLDGCLSYLSQDLFSCKRQRSSTV